MHISDPLTLYEELLLLSLREKEGTMRAGSWAPHALAGAIVAELMLRGRVRVEHPKKKLLGFVAGPGLRAGTLGDDLLGECLAKIRDAKRRASIQSWVSRFANMRGLKGRVARQLVRRGIVRADEDKVLGIFTRKIYPEIDPKPERALIERLRAAVLAPAAATRPGEPSIDARTSVLLALAKSAEVLPAIFTKAEIKANKKRLEAIQKGDLVAKETREAIEALRAALIVAAVMPAIVASH